MAANSKQADHAEALCALSHTKFNNVRSHGSVESGFFFVPRCNIVSGHSFYVKSS